MNRKDRMSNFELLRIISMLIIVIYHFALHGNIINSAQGISKAVSNVLFIGGTLGVNLFVLIGGYFMVDTDFRIKRLLKLWFATFFYSALISIIGYYHCGHFRCLSAHFLTCFHGLSAFIFLPDI